LVTLKNIGLSKTHGVKNGELMDTAIYLERVLKIVVLVNKFIHQELNQLTVQFNIVRLVLDKKVVSNVSKVDSSSII
jgi:hypothetical protein